MAGDIASASLGFYCCMSAPYEERAEKSVDMVLQEMQEASGELSSKLKTLTADRDNAILSIMNYVQSYQFRSIFIMLEKTISCHSIIDASCLSIDRENLLPGLLYCNGEAEELWSAYVVKLIPEAFQNTGQAIHQLVNVDTGRVGVDLFVAKRAWRQGATPNAKFNPVVVR